MMGRRLLALAVVATLAACGNQAPVTVNFSRKATSQAAVGDPTLLEVTLKNTGQADWPISPCTV